MAARGEAPPEKRGNLLGDKEFAQYAVVAILAIPGVSTLIQEERGSLKQARFPAKDVLDRLRAFSQSMFRRAPATSRSESGQRAYGHGDSNGEPC